MRNILVVDQSTNKTAYNIISIVNNKPVWKCCSMVVLDAKLDSIQRSNELYNFLSEMIDEYNIDTLVLEDVPVSRKTNLNVSVVLLKLLGIMELLAEQKGIKKEIMNVAFWKNKANIKSKTRTEQKKESIQLALSRWQNYATIISKSDDVADALNMGYAFLRFKNII